VRTSRKWSSPKFNLQVEIMHFYFLTKKV